MCGRFSLAQTAESIAQAFQLPEIPDRRLAPRYNIAPTQLVAAMTQENGNAARQLRWLRWGLIPSWAKDSKIGNRLINARAETLTQKPSFRHAFKRRRCLILADGFYEWKKTGNRKQPYYFELKNGQSFALAGLWETWQPKGGEAIASCTIVTTEANALIQPIHDRMPVILEPDNYEQWLDSRLTNTDALEPLLKPYKSELMTASPVSSLVNNPANDVPECLTPMSLDH